MSPEEGVTRYLVALSDPEELRDDALIEDLSRRLADANGPAQRLRLRAELARAENVDPEYYEADFVTHAKQWAEENDVPASAFLDEGVPPEVLARAGFDIPGVRRARRRRPDTTRTRVSSDQIRGAVPKKGKTFTLRQLQEMTGASIGSVRKVVQSMVAEGTVVELGASKEHEGPGRAPMVYKRA